MSRALLIRIFTFLGGIYFFLEYVLPEDLGGFKFGLYHDEISKGFTAVGAMAFGLGLLNLLMVHGSQIAFRRKGWINSIALISGLAGMITVTALDWRSSNHIVSRVSVFGNLSDYAQKIAADAASGTVDAAATRVRNDRLVEALDPELRKVEAELGGNSAAGFGAEDAERLRNYDQQLLAAIVSVRQAMASIVISDGDSADFTANTQLKVPLGELGQRLQDRLNLTNQYSAGQRVYKLLYEGLFISLGSAMFSLLGFYMAAAAYRAFRIRSVESGLMMAAALIVMLGQIPFGLWIWDGFSGVRLWLLTTPSTAAFRAIKLGAAVAGLVMAFRMWLSIETESYEERKS